MATTASTGLSTLLRQGTMAVHEDAESQPFVTSLTTGAVGVAAYTALVAQNLAIYTALERLAETLRQDPVAGPFVLDDLRRVPALQQDLSTLLGRGVTEAPTALVVDATRRYVRHLQTRTTPAGFLAHHYVRYLGDLSGGQILRRRVLEHYGNVPTACYVFEAIGRVRPFKDSYRALLDAAPLDAAGRDLVVAEAVLAFELNRDVFADLGRAYPPGARQL